MQKSVHVYVCVTALMCCCLSSHCCVCVLVGGSSVATKLARRHYTDTCRLRLHMQIWGMHIHTYTGCYKHILFMHEFCAKMSPRLKEKQKQIGMSAHMQTYIQLYIHIYLHILYMYICMLLGAWAGELWNVRHHMLKLISVFLFYLRHFECAAPLNLAFFLA